MTYIPPLHLLQIISLQILLFLLNLHQVSYNLIMYQQSNKLLALLTNHETSLTHGQITLEKIFTKTFGEFDVKF
jgi:hypothetical protein